jgi:flagellar motor switch/type III secretory pathway protein FliN
LQLGAREAHWVRIGHREGFVWVKLPSSWLAYAYRALGFEIPAPHSWFVANDVDLGVTAFLLGRMAADFSERSGGEISLSGLLSGDIVARGAGASEGSWGGARFLLELAGEGFEVDVVWPLLPEARRELLTPDWLLDALFSPRVEVGSVVLQQRDLEALDRGDVLLPDQWFPTIGKERAQLPSGAARVRLQSWSRRGELRQRGEETFLVLTSPWRILPKGAAMSASESSSTAAVETKETTAAVEEAAPVRVPEELEIGVTFELERMSVPLREILEWREGVSVRLERGPDDPVRIVLRQAGAERLLGYGRVLVVDDRLGVQIERWLVEKQG